MNIEVTKIIPVYDLNGSPARVNRKTGIVLIAKNKWQILKPEEKKFILQHEAGHYNLNTTSEILADNYAFDHFFGTEKESLRKTINIIKNTLDTENNISHRKRLINIMVRALKTDYTVYKNNNAKKILDKMQSQLIKTKLVKYLKSKGIDNLDSIPVEERSKLAIQFMATSDVQNLLKSEIKNELNYSGFDGDFSDFRKPKWLEKLQKGAEKGLNVVAKITDVGMQISGKFGAGVLTAFGVPVSAETITRVTKAINPLMIANRIVQKKQNNKKSNSLSSEPFISNVPVNNNSDSQINQNVKEFTPQLFSQMSSNPAVKTEIAPQMNTINEDPKPKKDNTKLFLIGGGILLVVIIVGAVLFFKSKK